MADSRYFQGHPNGFNITYISTVCDGASVEEDIAKRITFGSNNQNVGWTESRRAYLNEGIFDSHVKVMDGDREGQVFAVDCSPIAVFANPSYITDGKRIVYHNAIEGTKDGVFVSMDRGCDEIYEFDLEEFREFAGSWNDRHCSDESWVPRGFGTMSLVLSEFNHFSVSTNSAIFPPLKSYRSCRRIETRWNPVTQRREAL